MIFSFPVISLVKLIIMSIDQLEPKPLLVVHSLLGIHSAVPAASSLVLRKLRLRNENAILNVGECLHI